MHARLLTRVRKMRAEFFPRPEVASFGEKVQIKLADKWRLQFFTFFADAFDRVFTGRLAKRNAATDRPASR